MPDTCANPRPAAVLLALSLWATSALARDVDPINNCTTISRPGNYRLVANVTATASNVQTDLFQGLGCIVITTSNVTLDLGGHTVTGPPGARINGIGIFGIDGIGNGLQGIEVHDGVVIGFYNGVTLYGSGHAVENVRSFNNEQEGITLPSVSTGTGFGNRVVGNITVGNGNNGISVQCPTLVLQNTSSHNGNNQIIGEGTGCTLAENVPAP